MMKAHLVDGTYELFRAYHGAPSATDADGREVGATRAFMRSMAAMLREPDVTHVGVAFDTEIASFRNTLFAGYKTGEGIEEALHAQFPLVEEAAEALGLVVWRMLEFEADDALATAAAELQDDPQLEQVVICSPDKDLTQCVRGTRVVCWDRLRDRVVDEDGVIAKLGVLPASVPDFLALVGDSADGIPGVPRWGARSAATLLAHYHHVDAIPDDERDWAVKVRGAKALAAALRERREDALLYRQLATLRTDVPLSVSVDSLAWRGANRHALESVCQRVGERTLVGRISRWR